MQDTVTFLRGLPLLAELSEEDLDRLARGAERVAVPAGGVVMEEGSAGDGLYIVVGGELEVVRGEGAAEMVLSVIGPGAFLGEMSLVEQAPRNATIRAVRPSEMLVISPTEFHALLAASPAAAMTILRTFAARLRSTEASLRQNAQLISLGTLAAGLAHELNNPAAALGRGASALDPTLEELDRCAYRLGRLGIDPDDLPAVHADAGSNGGLDRNRELAMTNLVEDDVAEWLDTVGVDRPATMAAPLVHCGWTVARLEGLVTGVPSAHGVAVLDWLAARCAIAVLVEEVGAGAAAITEIVAAVRAHTYLGQSPLQTVDVTTGLETALVILRGRLGPAVRVVRDYSPDRPLIEAYGGELNQVWSNLIDNAAQAVGGEGVIELRVGAHPDGVVVEVVDSGPGIAPEVLSRIFDPFFTTKPFGTGSGLGLHVAYTIVRRHGGRIEVTSRPGRTAFRVALPLRLHRPRA